MQVDISPVAAARKVADRLSDCPAILYEGASIGYRELVERAGCLAGALAAGGVTTGRQVAYLGLNSPTLLVTYLACAWLGAVFVPVNFRLTADEVQRVLEDCEAHTLVVEPGHQAVIDAITRGVQDWRQLLIDDDPSVPMAGQPGRRWTLLSAALAEAPRPVREPVRCDVDDLAILAYTSGTTGRAKGVQLTRGNIWWNGINIDSVADTRRSDVNLAVAPLFHVGTLNSFTLRSLARGGTTVIRRKFDPDQTLRDLVEYRVNTFFAVPSMFAAIARAPGFADIDLPELRTAIVAGAPVPPQLILDYADRGVMLQQAWGLTETAPCSTYLPAELTVAKAGSAGQAMPFTEIRLTDPATGSVITEPDVRGQVCVRGANVTPGYWRNPQATEAAIDTHGWFHSGDIGYLDSDGYLFIVDRLKDMIITSGENVYPAEVEHALTGCPGLCEVAVIGMAHDTRGEAVVAVATPTEGAELTLDIVRQYASARLAQYKLPVRLCVVDSILRNATGKVDKNVLRASLADQDSQAPPDQQLTTTPIAQNNHLLDARNDHLVELVESATIQALGHRPPHLRDGGSFGEMGLDSLAAVDLRDRLAEATGLWLPATLAFDYPNPTALAKYLRQVLSPAVTTASASPTVMATAASSVTVADADPIAIVGMACRYPGRVETPEDLWEMVESGMDAVSAFPTDRGWNLAQLYDPDPDHAGTAYTREGGFLDGVAEFDADFFRISPREALAMDPQQRLLLEVSWEALERAGIDPATLRGSATGVFTGVMYNDYGGRFLLGAPEEFEGYLGTGSAGSLASGRVSYAFGFEGPALSVDTACSSSMVALHLAVTALRRGECNLALAGGVTVMATPNTFIEFSRQRGVSPDGRCKSFAQGADGAGWSEGVGVLLVEKLSDAYRHAHPVLALVRGSAVNQDGASNRLTAPNGPAQQRVIRAALADAHLSPVDVDVIEAHGTGTQLGDPIEAQALLATYGQNRPLDRPLWLGSIKSNIGHAQAAAGVAGVIKMVMAMRQGVVPRTLHVDQPTQQVDWSAGGVELLTCQRDWPDTGHPRRAGVSSFGVSGTNAHVILEQAPPADLAPGQESAGDMGLVVARQAVYPWILSGKSPGALRDQASRLREFLAARPDTDTGDVARSLVVTRAVFDHRAVVVAGDGVQVVEGLRGLAAGRVVSGVVAGVAPSGGVVGKTVWVFPGQGAQWVGMGRELWETVPVFGARMAECERALAPYVDWSLSDVVGGVGGVVGWDRVDVVQPVSFAVMVSLAALWQSCGVCPDAVLGHSQGEIAAACVAGVLSLADAARVVALRSRVIAAGLAGRGGMLSVALPEDEVRQRIQVWDGRIEVAAVNGPAMVVVAGDPDVLAEIQVEYEVQGVRVRMIPVDYASHTAAVDVVRDELAGLLDGVESGVPTVAWYSTVDGDWVTGPIDAQYWYRNLRHAVGFEPAVRALAGQGFGVFVEVSSHPVLTTSVADILDDVGVAGVVCGTLRRDQGGLSRFMQSLAELFVRGVGVDWASLLPVAGGRVVLPTYPFQRQRFWLDAMALRGDVAPVAVDAVDARFWEVVDQGDAGVVASELQVDVDQPLSAVLPVLSRWRRRHRELLVVDSWRYRIVWKPATISAGGMLAGRWLVVASAGEVVEEVRAWCVQALAGRGAEVVVLLVGAADVDRGVLAGRLGGLAGEGAVAGVVSLLGLDQRPHSEHAVVTVGMAGTLVLVQALGDVGIEARLWAVTRGAVSVGQGDRLENPDQAVVWGMGRVVALEHPGRWGGLIDLPAVLDERAMSRLCSVLVGGEAEDQVAVRCAGVLARRLVRAPVKDGGVSRSWRARGTVVITGGTGALGAQVARWLAGQGAEHLLLVSRRGLAAPGAEQLRGELVGLGAAVTVAGCDVADRQALAELLGSVQPPVAAVVHAAGAGQVCGVGDMGADDLAEVMSAKVAGAVHLDELLGDRSLDAFVVFSSGAGMWGGGGQGAYGAANAFVDALVQWRRARGRVGTSVAWGLWAGGGMGDGGAGEQLGRRGLVPMAPELALVALQHVLDHDESVVAIADIDWQRFIPSFTWARHSPLLRDLADAQQITQEATSAARPSGSELAQRLAGLDTAAQLVVLTDLVRSEAAAVLGHTTSEQITPSRAFKDAGFDSLTAVELRNRITGLAGITLPATLVFDYPTPAAAAEYLWAEIVPDTPEPPAPGLAELDLLEKAVSTTSPDEETRRLIVARLRGLLDQLKQASHVATVAEKLALVTDDELFDFIDKQL
jgi:acyl transferase domain-containing protein/acyl-CoA synthetase (AMP-forming)/AMP-acid ligase II/NADP-dependent 3-hydroxy acid dehydrogenase YdfG/acyl carrier protein